MKTALVKSLLTKLWYRPGTSHRIITGPMRGMWFKCGPNTGLAPLYSGGERGNQRVYSEVVRPGDTVIDAGANWGVHTLYLARLVGTTGRVHAFEPHPEVHEELRWHVERNSLGQVALYACGLFDTDGVIPFVLSEATKTSHLDVHGDAPSDARLVNVPVRTLDSMAASMGLNKLRLIKIDIEGAEGGMLQGAAQTIQRFRPHIVVELHSPEQDLLVAKKLTDWGYKLKRVEGPELRILDRPWPERHGVWGTLHASPE